MSKIPGTVQRAVAGGVLECVSYCKRFALPASAQPSLREGSGTPKSSVGKVRPNPTESL